MVVATSIRNEKPAEPVGWRASDCRVSVLPDPATSVPPSNDDEPENVDEDDREAGSRKDRDRLREREAHDRRHHLAGTLAAVSSPGTGPPVRGSVIAPREADETSAA